MALAELPGPDYDDDNASRLSAYYELHLTQTGYFDMPPEAIADTAIDTMVSFRDAHPEELRPAATVIVGEGDAKQAVRVDDVLSARAAENAPGFYELRLVDPKASTDIVPSEAGKEGGLSRTARDVLIISLSGAALGAAAASVHLLMKDNKHKKGASGKN